MHWTIIARLVGAASLVVVLFAAGWTVNGWRLGNQIESMKAEQAEKEAAALVEVRKKEAVLVAQAEQIRKNKDAEINAINNRLNSTLVELRKRPVRIASSAGSPSCTAGTGASLFREDGEFLIGEAARADKLRQALIECYNRYDALRNELNKLE